MGYFQVRYNSSVVIYDRRAFIRLATDLKDCSLTIETNEYLLRIKLMLTKTKSMQSQPHRLDGMK